MLIVAALLLVISAVLLGTAIWERQFFWTLVDVSVSFVAAQMAVVSLLISVWHPELTGLSSASQWQIVPIATYLLGMFVGAATMVGISWAFGSGGLLWRWLWGALGLFLVAIPLSVVWEYVEDQNHATLVVIHGVFMAFALLFAGTVSCLGLLARALGWTIGDTPPEENPRQYRLATFFLIVAASGVLIAVGQWLFAGPNATQTVYLALAGVGIIASATLWAAILLSGVRAWAMAVATVVFVLTVAAAIYVIGEYGVGAMSRYEAYISYGPLALATAVTIAIPCLILRSRGWRWRRGKKSVAAACDPTLETAS